MIMDTQQEALPLIGRLVDRAITDKGWTKGNAAMRMQLSEPTLRLMRRGQPVSEQFYGRANEALGFPEGLLIALAEGDLETVRAVAAELAPRYRTMIAPLLPQDRQRRKSDAGS